MADLSPSAVSARLAALRARSVPMDAAQARASMEPPVEEEPWERAVARRLAELRALDELTRHLHRARFARRAR